MFSCYEIDYIVNYINLLKWVYRIYVDILTGKICCIILTSIIGELVHPVGRKGMEYRGGGEYRYFSQLEVIMNPMT